MKIVTLTFLKSSAHFSIVYFCFAIVLVMVQKIMRMKNHLREYGLGILERCQIPKIEDTDVKHDQFSRLEFFFPH